MEFSGGWDTVATLVDDRWVERRPRRPEVAAQLLRETRLLPWLAARLPLPVPVPRVAGEDPLVVRHALIPGSALERPCAEQGLLVGRFLRALHDCPATAAIEHGLAPAQQTRHDRNETFEQFRADVVPLLPSAHRPAALGLLDAARDCPADTVVHGDIGPEHILIDAGRITGVIDFGDAHLGDPAIDLAWALYGTPPEFSNAATAAYGVTGELRRRASVWHRLGPWHEVTHGLETGSATHVRSGLAGLLERLSPADQPRSR
ncbi:phosphotransferase [Nocardia cerradoensis]|uniref:phosphotransferase n=1 Tax=Nocardia cerradoensis TaxID=85688 RepID=UPI0002FAE2C0|nr:phosphotransferase [Nocardia cerradoensis]NKY44215.1 phosphotransferase [Nocardia cerradoensis]